MRFRRFAMGALVAAVLALSAAPARADIFKFRAAALGGVATGNGTQDNDFFEVAGGGATGVELGIQVLFIGIIVDYRYFFGGDSPAHMFSANLGGEWAWDITKKLSIPFRVLAGVLAGSIVEPEYRNVQHVGFGARAGVGINYRLVGPLEIGIIPQIGYHALLAGGADGADASHGWDLQALAHLRLAFSL